MRKTAIALLAVACACSHAPDVVSKRFVPTKNIIGLTVATLPRGLKQSGTPKCLEMSNGSRSSALVVGVSWKLTTKKPQEYGYTLDVKTKNGDEVKGVGALTLNADFPDVKQLTLLPQTVSPGIASCAIRWELGPGATSTSPASPASSPAAKY